MKQVLMILAGVMAVASGRMLQDENITSTLSNSSLIDEAADAEPELIDENTGDVEVAFPYEDEKPKPLPLYALPANYVIYARVNPSDGDSRIFAYTVAVAGEDASITSHTGSENPDEDDPVLYFKLKQPDTCDPNETAPTSFMTSKFQYPDPTTSPTLTTALKMCWKAPAGYYI